MNTDQELLNALILNTMKPESSIKQSIEFRVYYDVDTGKILDYTTDNLPGNYIIVDRDTFHFHRFDWTIQNGKITPPKNTIGKLYPDSVGTPCDPRDITIVVPDSEPNIKWKIRTHEN